MSKYMNMKITKADRISVFKDQISEAKWLANEAIRLNPDDGGTANFDCALVKLEKGFTYAEFCKVFEDMGLHTSKGSGYDKGYIHVMNYSAGEGNRNTLWARTFAKSLEEGGFKTSMYYQVD